MPEPARDPDPTPESPQTIATRLGAAYAARDVELYLAALTALKQSALRSGPAEVDAALPALVPILREANLSRGRGLPVYAYDIAVRATSPGPLLPVFVDRAVEALNTAAAQGTAEPDPEAAAVATDWTRPVLWLCNRSDVRAALPRRAALTAAVTAAAPYVAPAGWLTDLLRVLDGEPLLVLHRGSGKAFRVTIGGIGDNFQLSTLLAVHLIGAGLVPGTPPTDEEASAATDGPVRTEGVITGRFEPYDGYGERVWHEGVPADIPLLGGERVLVLAEPAGATVVWGTGRPYPDMLPGISVAELPEAEAAAWWAKVALNG